MLSIISRGEAKARGLTRYCTGRPCNRGHVAERTVLRKTCVECIPLNTKEVNVSTPQDPLHIDVTEERRNHNHVQRMQRQIKDDAGRPSRPYCVIDKLTALELGNVISASQRIAGQTFYRTFRRAHLDYLHAADMSRTPISGGRPDDDTEKGKRINTARKTLARQIFRLGGYGSYGGSCAWHVLGLEMVLKDWATSRAWDIRPLNETEARGVLISVLDVLVADDSSNKQDLDFDFLDLTKLRPRSKYSEVSEHL